MVMRILIAFAASILGLTRPALAQSDSARTHCTTAVARVLADTSIHPVPPELTVVPAIDVRWPKDARKPIIARFRVNADGRADLTTLELSGTQDQNYRRRLAEVLDRTQFGPGHYDGCAAPRWLTWTLTHTKR
jgi:hypothetical protein